ncbi:MAG: DUF692 domain-containing protein [Pseudomonadales bacterium]
MKRKQYPVEGAGLGLRRALLPELVKMDSNDVDFLELAPENWIGVGGRFSRQLRAVSEKYPFVCHGLSLSIGSPAPLDTGFLKEVKNFLETYEVRCYSEHLSYCSDDQGHLYDLMPIPFTEEAIRYVAARVRAVQDILERRLTLEHVSYYAAPGQQISELEFINGVLQEADCDLLLDVNNIYVNSVNFGYDPYEFLEQIDGDRTVYIHIAGHYVEAPDLRIDTHGSAVIDPVWNLLETAYSRWGVAPTLLERDFNFPPFSDLLGEIDHIRSLQQKVARQHVANG